MQPDNVRLIIGTFTDLFVLVFNAILIGRVLMAYMVSPTNSIYANMISLTEPLLIPVRKLLPKAQGVDFAPLVTFFLLQGLQLLIHRLLGA